ncbi:MAG: T9SS type A sorting domain-containing protein [Bacteroidales bacterium]|nr:T9SS type A sorting domain-containing protein [Bacteroidales bacterium]
MRAVCSPSGHSAWRTALFSTECGTIEHLPFTENFDAYADESAALIPVCWSRIQVWTAPFVGSSGRLHLYKGLVALPPLSDTIDASQLMISFRASAGGLLDIGIMDDPYDSTSFVSDTVLFVPGGMQEYEIPLSALSGRISTERYIALFNRDLNNDHYCVSVDDLVLDYTPSCWHPKDVTLDTAYGTTAVVSWTERSSASQWDVEYGPHGFTPGTGTGTIVTVYGNPATLTNLPSNSYLDFYVRADCGGGDVSQWSHTCCSCTTMPCDSSDMCAIRIVMMDGLEGWTGYPSVGWGDACLDVYIDGVRQTSVTLTTSEPQTVFVPVCNHSRVALMQGGIGAVQEILISVFTSYGDLLAENLSGSSAWIAATLSCDTLLAFYNDCDIVMCVAPYHLIVDSIGAHEAILDWESFGSESSWMVEYRAENDTAWSSVIANTHPFVLNSLAAQTSYYVRVRAICDDGGISEYRSTEHFNTSCDGVMMHTVGSPSSAGMAPDDRYPYAYSQQIYTAEELRGVEDINSFQLMNAHYFSEYVWDIYLGHTTKSRFQDRNDFVDPQSLSLVYSGTIHDYDQTPQHWVSFNLDSTFHYNGTDNLVLAVYNHIGEYRMDSKWMIFLTGNWSDHNYQCFTATSMEAFSPTSQTLTNMMSANVTYSKNHIRFPKCCATPYGVSVQPNATDTTATITWQPGGGESRWVLEYKLNSATEWTSVVCHQPSYLIADVVPSVQYMGRVMAVCDTASGEGSSFVDFTFTVVPAAPEAYSILSSAGPGGTILPTGNINVMSGYDMTFDIVADTAAGYVIQDVLVDEVSQGPVPTYTFYAVDADHTIRAEFQNVGIGDFPEESLVLYPNPTNGKLRIENGELTIEGVEVYDVYGKLLQTVTVNDVAADLDVSVLPAGLYFARIRTDNGVVTKRFVKR